MISNNDLSKKIDRLEQIHDFSTIQTTFLAIAFSLLIFSLTAIIAKFSPILTVISILMLVIEFVILYFLLISIFSYDWESKLMTFGLVIFFIIFIALYLAISFSYATLGIWLYGSFEVDNIGIVIILFLTVITAFPIDHWIVNPRYEKRFKLLYEKQKEPSKYWIINFLNSLILKGIKKFGISFMLSLFAVIISGLKQTPPGYGFPGYWLLGGKIRSGK